MRILSPKHWKRKTLIYHISKKVRWNLLPHPCLTVRLPKTAWGLGFGGCGWNSIIDAFSRSLNALHLRWQVPLDPKTARRWNGLHSLKTNIAVAPENRPSQKESHLPTFIFRGQTVSFREGNLDFNRRIFLKQGGLLLVLVSYRFRNKMCPFWGIFEASFWGIIFGILFPKGGWAQPPVRWVFAISWRSQKQVYNYWKLTGGP